MVLIVFLRELSSLVKIKYSILFSVVAGRVWLEKYKVKVETEIDIKFCRGVVFMFVM